MPEAERQAPRRLTLGKQSRRSIIARAPLQ
jgi:hypothetical protein